MFDHLDEAKSTQSHVVAGVDHHHSPTRLNTYISQIKVELREAFIEKKNSKTKNFLGKKKFSVIKILGKKNFLGKKILTKKILVKRFGFGFFLCKENR